MRRTAAPVYPLLSGAGAALNWWRRGTSRELRVVRREKGPPGGVGVSVIYVECWGLAPVKIGGKPESEMFVALSEVREGGHDLFLARVR
jgi:hypothetical protein